jgi:hypothetical protein
MNDQDTTTVDPRGSSTYVELLGRLEALEKDNASLRKAMTKTKNRTYKSTRPGMKPATGNICAKFYKHGKNGNQGYTIDAQATIELHGWNPVDIVRAEWLVGSVQHRVKVSLLNRGSGRDGKKGAITAKEWLENNKQSELHV